MSNYSQILNEQDGHITFTQGNPYCISDEEASE